MLDHARCFRRLILSLLLIVLLSGGVSAAELFYQEKTQTSGGLTTKRLTITARQDGADIWQMVVNLGRSDNHWSCLPGAICSFKDLQHPLEVGQQPFEYAAPIVSATMFGLMRFGSMSGTFSDSGGRTAAFYRFTNTRTIRTGLRVRLTCTILAPQVDPGGGYTSRIEAECAILNDRSDAADIASCGLQNLNLNLNVDGLFDTTIVGQLSATTKPVLHDTLPTDGHPLYIIEDWYGDLAHLFDGPMVRMTVRDCPLTAARGMRPGLVFEVSAPEMSLADVQVSGQAAGLTMLSEQQNLHGLLLASRLPNPVAGMTQVPPYGQLTMHYTGSITAPAPSSQIDPELIVTAGLSCDFVYQNAAQTTLGRHRAAVNVQVQDESTVGNTTYAVTLEQIEGPGQPVAVDDPQGDPLRKYLVGPPNSDLQTVGSSRWRVSVVGNVAGSGSTEFVLIVRPLGDVDGNGFVEPTDKGLLSSKLNGLTIEGTAFEAFDIDGNGFIEPTDKGLLNNLLNGVTVN